MAIDDMEGEPVLAGTWFYDGTAPKRVEIVARNFDQEHVWALEEVEHVREDHGIELELPGAPRAMGPDRVLYHLGGTTCPDFDSIEEVKAWADTQAWGPVTWDQPTAVTDAPAHNPAMSLGRIVRETMFVPLLIADPSFVPAWEAFVAEWGADGDLPLTIALGSYADHLIQCAEGGNTSSFWLVFSVVERWLVEGDAYVREVVVTGLLEGLQNRLGGQDRLYKTPQGLAAIDFEQSLLPESKAWWEKLYRSWDGERSLLQF